MSQKEKPTEILRINFLLERRADPLLFDELYQFRKGSKRTEQLRILAHDGVLARRTSIFASYIRLTDGQEMQIQQEKVIVQVNLDQDMLSEAAHDMFGPPIES